LTAVVIFWSKYLSNANEKINNENTEISIEGIKVNNEKKTIYFLLAIEPLTFIFALIEFEISLKISIKNNTRNIIFK
tara:strand:- start:914 stop:1144 length:231 start_codon:yes stop_codon:yes gene_type:complete